MATDDRDVLFRAQRLVDGGSPMADALLENASLRTRIAALESQLSDRHAERVREIDAHAERVAGLEAQLAQYRWRRVEDEMPEVFEGVIVAGPDRRTEAFIDEQGRWRWGGTANIIREFVPTHWMPLPPAPEEGE